MHCGALDFWTRLTIGPFHPGANKKMLVCLRWCRKVEVMIHPSQNRGFYGKTAAFTLIELLIVIAIIAEIGRAHV